MARTPNQTQVTQHITTDADTKGLPTMADAWNEIALIEQEVNENAFALAKQISYDGPLTVGGAEDRLRQGMRRTITECLEMGKTLLILKELVARGEFMQRVELLGIQPRMAQKFMAATYKFSNANSNSLLSVAGTQTKMLELLILDDGEIEALESGETVRGLTLDKIETMSVSELKKALRDANERIEAKDAVIKDKSAKIDTQAETIASLAAKKQKADAEPVSVDQGLLDARSTLQATAIRIKMDVMSRLMKQVTELLELDKTQGNYAGALVIDIKRELDIVAGDCGLPTVIDIDLTPEWMRPGALDGLEAQYTQSPSGSALPTED